MYEILWMKLCKIFHNGVKKKYIVEENEKFCCNEKRIMIYLA